MQIKHKFYLGENVICGDKIGRISAIRATTSREKGFSFLMEDKPVIYYVRGINMWVQEQFLTSAE